MISYRQLLDEYCSSEDSTDEDSDSYSNEEGCKRIGPMLFESFRVEMEKKCDKFESAEDISDTLTAKDGRRIDTKIVMIQTLKFMKQHVFNIFEKKNVMVRDTESGQLRAVGGIEDVQWILSIPAHWGDADSRACRKLQQWSKSAGLIKWHVQDHLRMVYETDCKSISCQYQTVNAKPLYMAEGSRYLLIDTEPGMEHCRIFMPC